MAKAAGLVEGVINIRTISSVVSQEFDAALAALHRHHPGVGFHIDVCPWREVIEALKSGKAEVGIACDSAPGPALRDQPLMKEVQQLYCGTGHPLRGQTFPDPAALADAAFVLTGADIPYIEHWHREPVTARPCWAMRLRDRESGRKGALIRLGNLFMYARERNVLPPPHLHLRDCVAGEATLDAARDLLDCEISQGAVTRAGWIVQRSSLPFREGRPLAPVLGPTTLATADTARVGGAMVRHWEITDLRGTPGFDVAANEDPYRGQRMNFDRSVFFDRSPTCFCT